jgi:hypothetical protein
LAYIVHKSAGNRDIYLRGNLIVSWVLFSLSKPSFDCRLSLLANFHKSKQNPYIQRIQETDDKDLMRKICWASNFALDAVVKWGAFLGF